MILPFLPWNYLKCTTFWEQSSSKTESKSKPKSILLLGSSVAYQFNRLKTYAANTLDLGFVFFNLGVLCVPVTLGNKGEMRDLQSLKIE